MTAKESKAVAWQEFKRQWAIDGMPKDKQRLAEAAWQSALHAAEADRDESSRRAIQHSQHAAQLSAELGELRRRVESLVSDLVALAKHHEIKADRPYQDEGTTNWHSGYDEGITECADRLRQLLASDGGAAGDNEELK